jgi:hypothetical protein
MEQKAPAPKKRKWLRRFVAFAVVLSSLLLVLAYLFPYLLKRYIEEHSVEWIDRKITIGSIVLDPFTFTYGIYDLVCTEPKGSQEVFVSWKEVSVKADLWSGWRENAWRFRKARVIGPYVHIAQHGDRFNFSDLMDMASQGDPSIDRDKEPTVFSIEDIQFADGAIDYMSDLLHTPAGIRGLYATCSRITSENSRMDFVLGFTIREGGSVDGGFMIDTERSLYSIDGTLRNFALPQLLPYLQDLLRARTLSGTVDLDLHLRDSWADTTALAVRAGLRMSGVDITDEAGGELIGMREGEVRLDTLDARSGTFDLRRIRVDGLHTRFELFNDGSHTWSRALKLQADPQPGDTGLVLAASEDNVFVMLADYIRMLGEDLVANKYNADSLVLTHGEVRFNDFTPELPFRYELSNIGMSTARASSESASVDIKATAELNGRGKVESAFKFDPKNFKNVDAALEVRGMSLVDLDAYMRWYAAFPVKKGSLDYDGSTSIKDGRIDSKNHFIADALVLGKKTDAHDTGIYVLPLRLAVGLLKDKDGRIDLDVPVQGDINDPEFKPWPIVWQVVKNLFTKAVAAPGRLLARAIGGGNEEVEEEVRFEPLQTDLRKEQIKALRSLVEGLKAKGDLSCDLVPLVDPLLEREELAAFLAKKEMLGLVQLTGADSERVMNLSVKDTALIAFLDARSPTTKGRPERERCMAFVGPEQVMAQWQPIVQQREAAVLAFLGQAGASPGRINVRKGTAEELRGRIGRPGYWFSYDVADDEDGSSPPAKASSGLP